MPIRVNLVTFRASFVNNRSHAMFKTYPNLSNKNSKLDFNAKLTSNSARSGNSPSSGTGGLHFPQQQPKQQKQQQPKVSKKMSQNSFLYNKIHVIYYQIICSV